MPPNKNGPQKWPEPETPTTWPRPGTPPNKNLLQVCPGILGSHSVHATCTLSAS